VQQRSLARRRKVNNRVDDLADMVRVHSSSPLQ
jgi:hypothetical protein